jgi:hypothetical protein
MTGDSVQRALDDGVEIREQAGLSRPEQPSDVGVSHIEAQPLKSEFCITYERKPGIHEAHRGFD